MVFALYMSVILILISPAGDFQLITWSKDRTLRFWPIDAEVMHVCAYYHSPMSTPAHFNDFCRKLVTYLK